MAAGDNNPPKSGVAKIYYVQLRSAADNLTNLTNPTIAAGDFKISIDDGAEANLTTLPSVSPANSGWVKIPISAAEFASGAHTVKVRWSDQTADKEWADGGISIPTTTY